MSLRSDIVCQLERRMGRIKHFKAFSYIDVIYGMTVTMIIMGVVFGSIRVMEKRLRQNHLLTLADSFSNQIFEEIALRNYDENIDSIVENGLTTVFGVETGFHPKNSGETILNN